MMGVRLRTAQECGTIKQMISALVDPTPLGQYLIEILPDLGPEFVNSIAEFLGQLLPNPLQVFQVPILSRNKSDDKRP